MNVQCICNTWLHVSRVEKFFLTVQNLSPKLLLSNVDVWVFGLFVLYNVTNKFVLVCVCVLVSLGFYMSLPIMYSAKCR